MGWEEAPPPPSYIESHECTSQQLPCHDQRVSHVQYEAQSEATAVPQFQPQLTGRPALEELTFRPATPPSFPEYLPEKPQNKRSTLIYHILAGVLLLILLCIIIWLSVWNHRLEQRLTTIYQINVSGSAAGGDLSLPTVTKVLVSLSIIPFTINNTATVTATSISVNTTFVTRTTLSVTNNVVTVTAPTVPHYYPSTVRMSSAPASSASAGSDGCHATAPPVINTEFCILVDACNATLATAANVCNQLCQTGACRDEANLDIGESSCCGKCGCFS